MPATKAKDCIIVGGGPAGLTAALYLARFLRNVAVFDSRNGRTRMIPKTHNLGPFPGGISGEELLDRMQTHAENYGAKIADETVTGVERHGDTFRVTTDRKVETARNVIFASGVVNHRPPLSVEEHSRGVARGLIRYCPVCDAFEVRNKRIAVLGNGEHGDAEATFIRHYSATVVMIPPQGTGDVSTDSVTVPASPLKALALSDTEVIVTLQNGTTHRFDTLYVALGTTARTDLALSLGVRLAEGGCIVTDAQQRTSIDGIYAIGDLAVGLDQIAVAMGQGAVAATAIHNDLNGHYSGSG